MNVAITFAGRRDRMSILQSYMNEALATGILQKWHVWDYSRTPEDAEWIASLESDKIKVFAPSQKDTYEDCYAFYTPDKFRPDDVFVKIDDDIVFVDLPGLQRFVDYRRQHPEYYILSANVVNNPTCTILQKDEFGFFKKIRFERTLTAEAATAMHRAFLEGEFPEYQSIVEYKPEIGVNINCIAWLGADLESVSKAESTSQTRDEFNLSSAFPRIFERPPAIFGPCVVCHLSFRDQDAGMPIEELLEGYRARALKTDP